MKNSNTERGNNVNWLFHTLVSLGLSTLVAVVGWGSVKLHGIEINMQKMTPGHTTEYMELMEKRIQDKNRELIEQKFEILTTNILDIKFSILKIKNDIHEHIILTTNPTNSYGKYS